MRKTQAGQAFILVLIVLAIGAVLVVPSLRLTGTALMSSPIVERQIKGLYAADAATEYILWKLAYAGFGGEFEYDGQRIDYKFYVCEVPVAVAIVMRATEGTGGMVLSGDDVIRPTKTVFPEIVNNNATETITYTIRLEQLSEDNSEGLDAVYDILPKAFSELDYDYTFGSWLSVDGGGWKQIDDPLIEEVAQQVRLKWPADYDYETGTGAFSSDLLDVDHYFHGIRDFEVRQVKELRFRLTHEFKGEDKDSVHCNWVVLKPWNTLSGSQAPITVGSPAEPGVCSQGGLFELDKASAPEIIQPGVETDILYTISITNLDGLTRQIEDIIDYLPPGFTYIGPTSGDITNSDPYGLDSPVNINGVDRYKLQWIQSEFLGGGAKSVASGETLYLSFWARTTKDVSGSYYNEVIVIPDAQALPTIFSGIGVSVEEYFSTYSWNTGAVIVPAYDTSSEAEGITINSNMALILGGITITSWQVE